jgi:hypothetical protein
METAAVVGVASYILYLLHVCDVFNFDAVYVSLLDLLSVFMCMQ